MLIDCIDCINVNKNGYIAGTGDGIVSVASVPSIRKIYLFDEQTNILLQTTKSTKDGHYIFMGLEPSREYTVMVKDFKPDNGEPYMPTAWSHVKPATDITIQEQFDLWKSWQV